MAECQNDLLTALLTANQKGQEVILKIIREHLINDPNLTRPQSRSILRMRKTIRFTYKDKKNSLSATRNTIKQ